jgi:class 3 adenylate cyclase
MTRARIVLVAGLIVLAIALWLSNAINWLGLALSLPYTLTGGIVAVRRPRNPIGWLLIATGWGFLAGTIWPIAPAQQFQSGTVAWPAALLAWIASWGWFAAVAFVATIMVIFPLGHLPSGRWRGLALALLALIWLSLLLGSLAPTFYYNRPGVDASQTLPSPLLWFLGRSLKDLLQLISSVGDGLLFIALISSAVSVVVRYRQARGTERQQLLWFVAGLIAVAITVWLSLIETVIWGDALPDWALLPTIVAFVCLPLAIAVAVLRYRLYDVETIINRAVLYGVVTAAVLALFGVANLAVQSALVSWTGSQSNLLTGFVGLAIGSQYPRLRNLVRPIVDRFLPSRAVLTLLFTDIVGSTERIVELGDERWRSLLARYRAAVRQDLARFGGHEVDTAGDAFYATFERPDSGVSCALAVRSDVRSVGLELRTGIHMGECEMRGEKVSGIEVHVAARVMAAAAEGEILLSEPVREALRDESIETVDRGARELKGLPGTWQLYALQAAAT